MKKYIPLLAFILLVFVSAASMLIKLPDSSELNKEETKDNEGRVVRIDYKDDKGQLKVAEDKQYASLIRTYEDSNMVMEEYFDSKGKRTDCISGYSILCRSYYDDGRADTDTYLDRNKDQIKTKSGYYGFKRIYDAGGRIAESDYIDKSGQLMENIYGVAVYKREFYEDGRVKREFYYDRNRQPTTSYAGQYGEYREYYEDGKLSLITFLDIDGNPVKSNLGYATVRRKYDSDGKLYEIRYFDVNDNPTTGGYRHYGERYIKDQTVYLDSDGRPMKRLDNYLGTHPAVVIVFGLCLTLIALFARGSLRMVLLVDYVLFILFMTMWYRETGYTRSHFDLFWSYRKIFIDPSLRQSIINNIWLFVPLGALLYKSGSRRYLVPVFLSIIIEAVQYITGIGLCELDDVFSNSMGGFIGYMLISVIQRMPALRHESLSDDGEVISET